MFTKTNAMLDYLAGRRETMESQLTEHADRESRKAIRRAFRHDVSRFAAQLGLAA